MLYFSFYPHFFLVICVAAAVAATATATTAVAVMEVLPLLER